MNTLTLKNIFDKILDKMNMLKCELQIIRNKRNNNAQLLSELWFKITYLNQNEIFDRDSTMLSVESVKNMAIKLIQNEFNFGFENLIKNKEYKLLLQPHWSELLLATIAFYNQTAAKLLIENSPEPYKNISFRCHQLLKERLSSKTYENRIKICSILAHMLMYNFSGAKNLINYVIDKEAHDALNAFK